MTPLPASKVTNFHRPIRNYAWIFIHGSLPAWRMGRGAALAVGSWAVERPIRQIENERRRMIRGANHAVGEWAAKRPMSLSATPVCALRAFGGWCAERTIRQIENERGERSNTECIWIIPRPYQEQIPKHQNIGRTSGNSYPNPNSHPNPHPYGSLGYHQSRRLGQQCSLWCQPGENFRVRDFHTQNHTQTPTQLILPHHSAD